MDFRQSWEVSADFRKAWKWVGISLIGAAVAMLVGDGVASLMGIDDDTSATKLQGILITVIAAPFVWLPFMRALEYGRPAYKEGHKWILLGLMVSGYVPVILLVSLVLHSLGME
jgi:hypothetical protein